MKDKIPTAAKIELTLKSMAEEYPELFEPVVRLHSTGMFNKDGEPLFLANVGIPGHPMFIGGTKAQLEERINRFFKNLKDSI